MKNKFLLLFISIFFFPFVVSATHIVGGSLTYEQLGGSTYRVTLKLYRDCAPGNAAFDNNITIEVLQANGTPFTPSKNITIPIGTVTLLNPYIDTCVVQPNVCVQEALYTRVVNNLPPATGGYHLFWQRCCRNYTLSNVDSNPPPDVGESFYTFIPDNNVLINNSSPTWVNSPPTFVCQSQPINFNHAATDADGDSLVYTFYDPYLGCDATTVASPACPTAYPTFPGNVATFSKVVWLPGYSTNNPLGGGGLTLSPTGLLNGSPPSIGQFVVGVKCEEWRNGVRIGEILRDFQFNVLNCPPLAVPDFTSAGQCSGTAVTFTNTTTPAAYTYFWNFGNTATLADTSNATNPSYTYPALGTYTVTLIANRGTACADTVIKTVSVSSITANFTNNGAGCIGLPVNFTDGSTVPGGYTITNWKWTFGDGTPVSNLQNPTHTYTTSGTFNVKLVVTSSAGCKDSITKTITIQPLPVPNFTPNGACQSNVVTFTNTTAPAANTYSWNFGNTATLADTSLATNPTYTYPGVGTYTVTLVINKNTACARTITKTVIVAAVNANFTDNRPGCTGLAVNFTDSSTTSPNTTISGWEWDFGDAGTSFVQNPSHTYIASGTYDVMLIVTSTSGCKDTIIKQITIQNIPVPNFTTGGLCKGTTIKFTNTTSPPGSTYFWDFGNTFLLNDTSNSTNPTYTYPTFGTYTVTLTANKFTACAVTITKTIVISSVIAEFTDNGPGCVGMAVSFKDSSTVSNGTITNWDWNFGDAGTSILTNPTHTYTVSGTYSVTLIVTTALGCKDTVVHPVVIQDLPVPNFTPSPGCNALNIIFTNTTAPAANTYFWDFGNTASLSDTSIVANPTYTYTTVGTYTVTLVVNKGTACELTTTKTITLSSVTAEFTSAATGCMNKSLTFTDLSTVSSNSTITNWDWDFGDTTTSILTNPSHVYLSGGTYNVRLIVTTAGGCKDTVIHTVTIQPSPIANAGNDTISCTNNASINLNGTVLNATGGKWIGSGTFTPNDSTLNPNYTPTPSAILNGKDTLYFITTGNGVCTADTARIIISFYSGPTVNAGPDIAICQNNDSIPLCATITVATGGVWKTSGTGIFADSTLTCTSYTPSIADTVAGSVVVYIISTGNGNCLASRDSVTITFTPKPIITITSNDTSCANNPIPFAANTTTGSGKWTSSVTGTFSPSDTSLSGFFMPTISGNVKLIFTSTNNGGCKSTFDTINVTLIPAPTAAFTTVSACPDIPVIFTDATTPVGTITGWTWDFGDGSSTSPLQNPTHVYSPGGTYTVSLIVTSTNGCIDTVNQPVNIYEKPIANFDPNGLCQKDGGMLFLDSSVVNGSTITSWTWEFGDLTGSPLQNPVHNYASFGTYTVQLIVQSAQGCKDTVSKPITVLPGPIAKFVASDYNAYINQVINFSDQSTNSPVSWLWDFDDSSPDSTSTLQNPSHKYAVGGYYDVCLYVTDANGCKDTTCQTIIIALPPVVPSGFTPNGDGENDIWYVYGGPFKSLDVKIYNNWGELIFTADKQSQGWDGKRNGIDQAIGVYVWIVTGVTENDEKYEMSGDVTLIR
ncbi:MAG: PKD domain-containing protein [Bacteroidota bacterium]